MRGVLLGDRGRARCAGFRGTERRRSRRPPPGIPIIAPHVVARALAAEVFNALCRAPGVDGRWHPDVSIRLDEEHERVRGMSA